MSFAGNAGSFQIRPTSVGKKIRPFQSPGRPWKSPKKNQSLHFKMGQLLFFCNKKQLQHAYRLLLWGAARLSGFEGISWCLAHRFFPKIGLLAYQILTLNPYRISISNKYQVQHLPQWEIWRMDEPCIFSATYFLKMRPFGYIKALHK